MKARGRVWGHHVIRGGGRRGEGAVEGEGGEEEGEGQEKWKLRHVGPDIGKKPWTSTRSMTIPPLYVRANTGVRADRRTVKTASL